MAHSKQFNLSAAIRQVIDELQVAGNLTTNHLTELVLERYPEICDDAKDMLFREAIAKRARTIMKKEAESWVAGQELLPLEIQSVRLPSNVSLPPKSGSARDVEWTRIEDATYRQLEAHINHLKKQVSYDIARVRELSVIRDMLSDLMADRPDEAIGPWLEEIKRRAA